MSKKLNNKTKITLKFCLFAFLPLLLFPVILYVSILHEVFVLLFGSVAAYLVYLFILFKKMKKKVDSEPYEQQDIDALLKGAPVAKPNILINIGKSLLALIVTWPLSYVVAVIISAVIPSLRWNNADEATAGTIISIIPTLLLLFYFQKEDKKKQTQKKIDFYKECLKQNIHQVQSPFEVQKAQLIAEKMGFIKV